jgi:hypothetical protein
MKNPWIRLANVGFERDDTTQPEWRWVRMGALFWNPARKVARLHVELIRFGRFVAKPDLQVDSLPDLIDDLVGFGPLDAGGHRRPVHCGRIMGSQDAHGNTLYMGSIWGVPPPARHMDEKAENGLWLNIGDYKGYEKEYAGKGVRIGAR